jgi:hypothetical protein
MSDPMPDPNAIGAPHTPPEGPLPRPVFKRAWFMLMAVIGVVLAVIVGFQVFG